MKYRIIERGDGKFIVQKALVIKGIFKDKIEWDHIETSRSDYPDDSHDIDRYSSIFSTLDLAKQKIKSLLAEHELKRKQQTFEVIEEVEV